MILCHSKESYEMEILPVILVRDLSTYGMQRWKMKDLTDQKNR